MLNQLLDLTYYTKVLEVKRKGKNYVYRITVTDILNVEENQENKLLSKYLIGNWKTREVFTCGVISKKNIANKYFSYVKGIPVELSNKLNLNKHDVVCLRLDGDIIWVEKIDDINKVEFKWLSKILNYNGYSLFLTIPSLLVANIKILIFYRWQNIEIVKSGYTTLIRLPHSIITEHDLKPDEKLYCKLIENYLTIEKISDTKVENKILFRTSVVRTLIKK